jgi:CRP-like cAMP-binding protein
VAHVSVQLPYVPCPTCPLRAHGPFKRYDADDISFLDSFKREHLKVPAGGDIITAGDPDAPLFTLFSGWAMRLKMLPDGRRQILNFLLPGDPIGFQANMFEAAPHSVQAITNVQLCSFHRAKFYEMFSNHPELAFDLTWLTAREEGVVDDNLVSTGQRNALERTAALIIHLYKRAEALGMANGAGTVFPLTQQHLADALGLSLVHTNKTLRKLQKLGLYEIKGGSLYLLNGRALEKLSAYYEEPIALRPLL